MKASPYLLLIFIFLNNIIAIKANDEKLFWPKEIKTTDATITLYQPQLESFIDNILEGRMALSVKENKGEPVFGAVWFKAKLATDLEERTAVLESMDIKRVFFPDFEDEVKLDKFTRLVIDELGAWDLVMSLDRLSASLAEVEDMKSLSVQLNNQPPNIYFRSKPAVLISIDGDPILKTIEGTEIEYVVNTAFFIVKAENKYYIKGGKFWYVSYEAASAYTETTAVPSYVLQFAEKNLPDGELDSISKNMTEAPRLIVATSPSELISTDGPPEYASIKGTGLLYVTNTASDVVMDISTQNHYVLLAGRWYYSRSLEDGDWRFMAPSDLPADFANIPEDSDIANVRPNVPGTPEAQDALLEQTIPQTATIDRNTAKLTVKWDGEPVFERIEGTDISVALNSDKTVLQTNDAYYCVDDAIWFISDYPEGPWVVSDVRPEQIDQIPPESEAYNVKYVYIYESTPEVVYVGYLPGYTWSYVYDGCVVYGTGYWYKPWYHRYYFPRPVTYGYGIHWNPYTGWGFTFGLYYGWIGWHFHPYARWWGPRGYYPGYRHGYYHGYHQGYRHGYRHGATRGYAAGYHARKRDVHNNVYRNRSTGVRNTISTRPVASNRSLDNKARPSNTPNNVYSDRSGNVYQRNRNGNWEQKQNNQTRQPVTRQQDRPEREKSATQPVTRQQDKPAREKPVTQPVTRQQDRKIQNKPQQQPASRQQPKNKQSSGISNQQKQQMNKSYQNRDRGTQKYNQSRSGGGKSSIRGGGDNRK